MPAQRRPHPHPSLPPPPPPPPSPAPPTFQDEEDDPQNQEDEEYQVQETEGAEEEQNPDDDSDEDGGDASEYNEFIAVKLADLRKEVQCPICLGIIRKTRTVMECLHRFCRECIDKSMRLGNNECPACRTHCASRRSLRDDPNFDALIAALFSDIDEYEKEELDLLEEEKNHYKKIQASIAETFRRQSEALGKRKSTAMATAAAFARKSPGSYRSFHGQCGRGGSSDLDVSLANSEDDEEEDANSNGVIEFSSSDEPSPDRRQKRRRRSATRSSLAQIPGNVGITHDKKCNVETKRDNRGTSPLQVGNGEILSWGGGGVRSQTRHGSSGSSGRLVKGGRRTKQVEHFSGLAKNDNEFDMHLALLPMDEQCAAKLQRPYICCRPSLSIRHLCQFIALQTSVRDEEVEILARKPCTLVTNTEFSPSEELQVVGPQESMAELRHSCTNCRGDLVFVYRFKKPS